MDSARDPFNEKAAPSENDVRSFINAVELGDKARVEDYLLRFGDGLVNEDSHGTTALMKAAYRDRREMMNFLLDRGANLEARNFDDDTALTWALFAKHPEAALLLIDRGATTTITNKMGKTPLDYAQPLGRQDLLGEIENPRYIDRTVAKGIERPLAVRGPLRFRRQ